MPKTAPIKPTHKAVKQYYAALQSYRNHQVTHEGASETAFGRLLEETAKSHGWKLIPKQRLKVGKSSIAPDGTLPRPVQHALRLLGGQGHRRRPRRRDSEEESQGLPARLLVPKLPFGNERMAAKRSFRTGVLKQEFGNEGKGHPPGGVVPGRPGA